MSPHQPWAGVLCLRYFGTPTRKIILEVKGALAVQKAPMDSHIEFVTGDSWETKTVADM